MNDCEGKRDTQVIVRHILSLMESSGVTMSEYIDKQIN